VQAQKSKVVCAQDRSRRARQELDRAIHARVEALYPDQCQGMDGQTFNLRMGEIRIQGDAATVSYVLVLFETCEEGSPYEASRHHEKWLRTAKGWELAEDGERLAIYSEHKTISPAAAKYRFHCSFGTAAGLRTLE